MNAPTLTLSTEHMSHPERRDQWAEHLRDEAHAIAAQQVAAGPSHEPQAGPLPHSRAELSDAAAEAVVAERQRCAAAAFSFADESVLLRLLPAAGRNEREAAATIAREIGRALARQSD